MAKDFLRDYDSTAANNTDVGGVNTDEGMLPSKVNDAIRELMSHLADFASGTEKVNAVSVDNLKLDGNTLSSTDTNGNIILDPNGTGSVELGDAAEIGGTGKWSIEFDSGDNDLLFKYNGTTVLKFASTGEITSAADIIADGTP
jgi:chitinase